MSRQITYRAGLVLAIIVFAFASVNAQSVVYDWSSDSKVPESYPTIRRRQTVTFRIRNVNKILYSYRLEITQTPIAGDDFSHLAGLFKLFRPSAKLTEKGAGCEGLKEALKGSVREAIQKVSDDPKLPVGYAKTSPHQHVPLIDSVNAWKSHLPAVRKALQAISDFTEANCDAGDELDTLLTEFKTTVENLDTAVTRAINDPDFVQQHDIEPGKDVSVTVVEMFGSEVIKTKTFTFPGVDVLTLSAGALFSRIPDRTYEARKSHGSTLNLLTVEGNSRATPSLAALLNYSLGSIGLDHDTAGLALSAGPVLKLGNQSEASSFGFFAGVSGHLYHRFYVTPGIHFGQFADFPVGFSNSSTVPENFGELTPVKRWTARFGLALSFKAKDFSGLTDSDKPSVTGNQASSAAASQPSPANSPSLSPSSSPSPSPSPSPEADTTLKLSNAPLSVAANFLRLPSRASEAPAPARANIETREPVAPRREDLNGATERPDIAKPLRPMSSTAASSITHVTSITKTRSPGEGERIILQAGVPIRDYAVSFRNGRFFLTIPQAHLDVIEDGLSGHSFTDATFERRGADLVISFSVLPGTKARVLDHPDGLSVDLFSGDTK